MSGRSRPGGPGGRGGRGGRGGPDGGTGPRGGDGRGRPEARAVGAAGAAFLRPGTPGEQILAPHGGYRKLKSFQVAQLVYDLTVRFCDRYIDRRSRTHDQMVQAARSGVQNIAEGSEAAATSSKFELKLTLATVAGFLLDRQMMQLAQRFEDEGGFTERLYRVRSSRRRSP